MIRKTLATTGVLLLTWAIGLASLSASASGFPVSLDEYLPQNIAPSHVYMQPDGSALVMSGGDAQLSVHRLDRDPLSPSFSNRFTGRLPSVLGSFEQEDGSFWAHHIISGSISPPPIDFSVSYWRLDPFGRLLQSGGARARIGSKVLDLDTGIYAISNSEIINLERGARTAYSPCTSALDAEIVGCALLGLAAANEGFWALRRLPEAPGRYRFEALRFDVTGRLQETQSIPGSYSAPAYAQFWRRSNLLHLAIKGDDFSLFTSSDSAGWQIVQAGTVQIQGAITPVGAGDWLFSTPSEIVVYTPPAFNGTLMPTSARYRSLCDNCTDVRSTLDGEVLAGRKSGGGYFKWLSREGSQKLELQGVYDAYFARDNSVLVLAPDDAANPRGLRAHWYDQNAQPHITEAFSPTLTTPLRTELFEGKNAQILAVADSRQSAELPIYAIHSSGDRVRISTSSPSRTSLPTSDSQPGSSYLHRKIYTSANLLDLTYESIDSETGTQFSVVIQGECAEQAGTSRFIALGAGVFDFRRCGSGPLKIRHIQAGQALLVGEIADHLISNRRTNPTIADGDEVRLLTRRQDQTNVLQVHGLSTAGLILRYQHLAADNAGLTLLADGSLLVLETVDGALTVRRVRENAVSTNYPLCGLSAIDDPAGNLWSWDESARIICHTTLQGVLSQTADIFPFATLLANNGDLIARNLSGRCLRLHAESGQIHTRAFGVSGRCSLRDHLVVDEHLYSVQRPTQGIWGIEPNATVLLKQALPSVAVVLDTWFNEGFE